MDLSGPREPILVVGLSSASALVIMPRHCASEQTQALGAEE